MQNQKKSLRLNSANIVNVPDSYANMSLQITKIVNVLQQLNMCGNFENSGASNSSILLEQFNKFKQIWDQLFLNLRFQSQYSIRIRHLKEELQEVLLTLQATTGSAGVSFQIKEEGSKEVGPNENPGNHSY